MRYLALATDYDGTLATHGEVGADVVSALERLLATGRRLIMVTGRELEDLQRVFPRLDLFERVVAENGGLLYCPATRQEQVLTAPPTDELVRELRNRGVDQISVGRSIIATWHPHETTVLETIRDLGLEHHVIFNKGAVMVLPSGVNKCSGLAAALDELGLSPHNLVGVGDAENDHAFLHVCECSAAVANALPALKRHVDLVTDADHGAGVVELIERLIADDLEQAEPRLERHHLLVGTRDTGQEVRLKPFGTTVLLAGPSGSGKSTMASAVLERLIAQQYQFCLIDPEGDYENLPGAISLGEADRAPTAHEVLQVLEDPHEDVSVNLLGLSLEDRPSFFARLLPRLQELRASTGRPHWVIVDEAHHMLPASWDPTSLTVPKEFGGVLLITVHPQYVNPVVLSAVDVLVSMGKGPERTVGDFCHAIGLPAPRLEPTSLESDQALVWFRHMEPQPFRMHVLPPRMEHQRHVRKYAEGDLGPEQSFYFRGPEGKLNLRAQNLVLFNQIAEGVDDATWMHHLRRGDYSRWFREKIKDDELVSQAERVEQREDLSPRESRQLIREAIEQRYTLPARPPLPIPGKTEQTTQPPARHHNGPRARAGAQRS